jgi:hypothetical protein
MIKLFLDGGVLTLTAFISPLTNDREMIKEIIGADNLIEIYCNCPLDICEQRDVNIERMHLDYGQRWLKIYKKSSQIQHLTSREPKNGRVLY